MAVEEKVETCPRTSDLTQRCCKREAIQTTNWRAESSTVNVHIEDPNDEPIVVRVYRVTDFKQDSEGWVAKLGYGEHLKRFLNLFPLQTIPVNDKFPSQVIARTPYFKDCPLKS